MPRLKLLLYQLERIMQIYIPDTYSLFVSKEIPFEVFSIQWYLTLFSHDFDPITLSKIWDLFLLFKWKFLFQLSVVILKKMTKKIEELEYGKLVLFLRTAIIKNLIPTVMI